MSNSQIDWCHNCGVPLISRCDLCKGDGEILEGDLKPVFGSEREIYLQELSKENLTLNIPTNLFRFKNKIIADGKLLFNFHVNGHSLEFDLRETLQLNKFKRDKDFLKQAVCANQKTLRKRESEAIKFIKKVAKHHEDKNIVVSFSGGKDSAITAYLVKKALGEVTLLFSNTGIEFPETVKFVREFAKNMGFELIEIRPLRKFMDLCETLGPPSRMMRWCCFTQKSAPINAFYSELNKEVLSFDGIRKSESRSRARFERSRKNTKIIRQHSAYPIFEWSDFEVWLYLLFRKIPMNPLYQEGYTRIGCWACPNNGKFDDFLLSKTHPNLSRKWINFLLKFAEENGKTLDWVYSGKWKQRTTKYEKFEVCSVQNTCTVGNKFLFVLKDGKFSEDRLEFFKVFGKEVVKDVGDEKLVQIIGSKVTIASVVNGNTMRVRFNDEDCFNRSMFEVKKQLEKALNCVKCEACVGSCPFGAIEVNENLRINEDKCKNCLACVTSKYLKQSCVALHYKNERNVVEVPSI